MPCLSKNTSTDDWLQPQLFYVDEPTWERWDSTDLDYYTEERLHIMSCICDIDMEYAEKVRSMTDAEYMMAHWIVCGYNLTV